MGVLSSFSVEMTKKNTRQVSNSANTDTDTSQLSVRVNEMEEALKSGLEELKSQITGSSRSPETHGDVIEKLEVFKISVMQSISAIKSELTKLVNKTVMVERTLLDRQQETLLNNIIIYGVAEEDGEDLLQMVPRIINSKLLNYQKPKVPFSNVDINYCRRLGKKVDGNKKPRPISVQFVNRWMRELIFKLKKHLKGSDVIITEQLVKPKLNMYNKARDTFGVKKCWSWNGNIYVCINGERKQIRNEKELADIVKNMTTDK